MILPLLTANTFTDGRISLVTLGMMASTLLEYSGQTLIQPRMTVLVFALLNVSVLLFVVDPVFLSLVT